MSVVDTATGEVLSGDVIEELDAAAARALTDRINHSTMLAAQLVVEAWEGRAWKSLGYRSWEDYADAELPLLGSTPANRHVLLVGLRKVGMSTRAIGVVTGLHPTTVGRHVSGAANAAPVTGTDGKQYDPSHPSRIRRSETVEFAGEAGTGDGPAMSSGGPSPTIDPGEATLGDDVDPSSPTPSPGSTTSDDDPAPRQSGLADQADGAGERAPSARLALHKQVRAATVLFTAWKPEQIHALNDPDLTRSYELLLPIVGEWFEEFTRTEPTGLTVIHGGKQ